MGQYLDYQWMIERITHKKIDKINGILCGKLEDILAFVKNFGDRNAKDAEAMERKFK